MTSPTYQVGDPDPTGTNKDACPETFDDHGVVAWCTWPRGHTGPHVAGTGPDGVIVAVWDD
jgi:hypothetical protein